MSVSSELIYTKTNVDFSGIRTRTIGIESEFNGKRSASLLDSNFVPNTETQRQQFESLKFVSRFCADVILLNKNLGPSLETFRS